ncbi:hypothetical protein [Mesorhizobium sp. M0408]|uniref:hypothetical protein n=1 Tax=Mesorhizobium sp. M0408 TaxID=2956942 RepID=UPI0033357749
MGCEQAFETSASILRNTPLRRASGAPLEIVVLCVTEGITANTFHMGNSLAIESNVVASRSPKKRSEPSEPKFDAEVAFA